MKAAIIAPANTMDDLPLEIRPIGIANLKNMGYDVVFGENVDKRYQHTAGTIEERLNDLDWALNDSDVELILPVFGGYNSNQLLDNINFTRLRGVKKKIMGFSDTTALLSAFINLTSFEVYHGPSFSVLSDPNLFEYTLKNCSEVLKGNTINYENPAFTASDQWFLKSGYGPREIDEGGRWKTYQEGEATGNMAGGNIDTLSSLAGTIYFPQIDDKILILENRSGNNPSAFHRSMTQLQQMGVFDRIKGLIIGKFPVDSILDDDERLKYILDDVIDSDRFPIVYSVHCSHVDPMLTLPFHSKTHLIADEKPRITVNNER